MSDSVHINQSAGILEVKMSSGITSKREKRIALRAEAISHIVEKEDGATIILSSGHSCMVNGYYEDICQAWKSALSKT